MSLSFITSPLTQLSWHGHSSLSLSSSALTEHFQCALYLCKRVCVCEREWENERARKHSERQTDAEGETVHGCENQGFTVVSRHRRIPAYHLLWFVLLLLQIIILPSRLCLLSCSVWRNAAQYGLLVAPIQVYICGFMCVSISPTYWIQVCGWEGDFYFILFYFI